MLTRTTFALLTPTARRMLGRVAWIKHARLHAAILLSLAMGAAALASDGSPGVMRVSDQPPAPLASNAPSQPAPVGAACNTCDPGACGHCGHDCNCRPGLLGRCCLFHENCGWRFLDAHCYCMTYAVNPWYCDGRDGRVYAAYGYGAPMTVPLAPTVTNQYNFGWGIPSGRLTPISRVAPRPGALTTAVAPY